MSDDKHKNKPQPSWPSDREVRKIDEGYVGDQASTTVTMDLPTPKPAKDDTKSD